MQRYSFPKEKMRILFAEGTHPAGIQLLRDAGYDVETRPDALSEAELLEVIPSLHVLGIRSKTYLSSEAVERAERLLAVGCFCIGTNQVALETAGKCGIPVFNAPFSNTRSVAELAMANIVMLSRKAVQRSMELHQGVWKKSASGCYEVRNKKVGIIGYGHIGPQIGLLAEAFGMQVSFHDVVPKLPLGTARPAGSLDELLRVSDFVTLHVPETPETVGMIGARELALMRPGSYLLNLSRGSVVDIAALRDALTSGHLAGAACDVYPLEPKSNDETFQSELRGVENVILTPHIGGSTQEAQENIGLEVATALHRFIETGSTMGAVNFPQIQLPVVHDNHRVLNMHRNEPGVLMAINSVVAELGANIEGQYLGTLGDVGYLIMDVNRDLSHELKRRLDAHDATIRTRLLF